MIETKKAIARGDIGEIMAVKAFHRGGEAAWRSERVHGYGGAFQDVVHMADALVWMIESPIVEVYAEAGCDCAAEAGSGPDAVFLHAAFANGATATIDLTRSSPLISPVGREFRLELVGTEGNLTLDAFRQRNESSGGIHSTRAWSHWGDDLHATFVDAAIASTRTDGYDFRSDDSRVYEAAAAAQESARIGKPVRLGSLFRNSRGETP
ncbi:Gfo/Idh/MocA family protein [Paenibacillus antri]|uniref:Gfo/Idh/MocA family protein n=1 Tax=Paenibacillus antri TaxID=2582848 RepID=UPI001305295F|nr:Gfo/Idh/MocA family oxidoreductase [Paenibacillus antri]